MDETTVKDQAQNLAGSALEGMQGLARQTTNLMAKGLDFWVDASRKFIPDGPSAAPDAIVPEAVRWIDSYFEMGEAVLTIQRDWVHGCLELGRTWASDGAAAPKRPVAARAPARR